MEDPERRRLLDFAVRRPMSDEAEQSVRGLMDAVLGGADYSALLPLDPAATAEIVDSLAEEVPVAEHMAPAWAARRKTAKKGWYRKKGTR
jgi:hypothetical protein